MDCIVHSHTILDDRFTTASHQNTPILTRKSSIDDVSQDGDVSSSKVGREFATIAHVSCEAFSDDEYASCMFRNNPSPTRKTLSSCRKVHHNTWPAPNSWICTLYPTRVLRHSVHETELLNFHLRGNLQIFSLQLTARPANRRNIIGNKNRVSSSPEVVFSQVSLIHRIYSRRFLEPFHHDKLEEG